MNYLDLDAPSLENHYVQIYINLTKVYSKEINYRLKNPYFKYERVLSFYSLFLIIIGTSFNLISFCIMNRKNMQKFACMRYLSALSLSDLLVLYQWNLNTFFKYNLSKPPLYRDLEELTLITCRSIAFLAFFSLQLSSWLLSIVSFDRLMMVYSSNWKLVMHKPSRIRIVIASIVAFIFLLNLHLLFLNGYIVENKLNFTLNETLLKSIQASVLNNEEYVSKNIKNLIYIPKNDIICYRSVNDRYYIFPKWEKAHLFVYTIIPFTIMCVSNFLIIYNVKYSRNVESKVKASVRRKRRMTFMLILVTFSFIVLTLPSVIVHTFFREYLKTKRYRRLVNLCVNNLLHTSHAINFFLYVFSAPNFRKELVLVLNNIYLTITRCGKNDIDNRSLRSIGNLKAIVSSNDKNQGNANDESSERVITSQKKKSFKNRNYLNSKNNNNKNHLGVQLNQNQQSVSSFNAVQNESYVTFDRTDIELIVSNNAATINSGNGEGYAANCNNRSYNTTDYLISNENSLKYFDEDSIND